MTADGSTALEPTFREKLIREVVEQENKARNRVKRWNLNYFATLFGSIVLASVAALLPKMETLSDGFLKRDLPSICAGAAALLSTLMHAGNFDRRWRASRMRKARIHELRIKLMDPAIDLAAAQLEMTQLIRAYHEAVFGDAQDGKSRK